MRKLLASAAAFLLTGSAAFAVFAAKPIKVACVGNSITYGFLVENREVNAYPVQLGKMLGEGYDVKGFGRPGATLLTKGHNPYVKSPEFQGAMQMKPDIVVMHLGVNDTDPRNWPNYNSEFVGDYVAMIDSFRSVNPDVRVIIANLSPLSSKHYRFRSGTRDWRILARKAIADVAKVTGAELIDFGDDLRDRQNLLSDGIHPNAAGSTIMAESVCSAITGNYGGLSLPEIYGSGMVLQRYKPIQVSGRANAGAKVTVSLAGNTAQAVADNRGRWAVELPALPEATGLEMKVSDGANTFTFSDVAVGEVWLASGQSNMEFHFDWSKTFAADSALCNDAQLRLFDMKPRVVTNSVTWETAELDSLDDMKYYLPSRWQKSTARSAAPFSAIAWYFGKMLRDSLDVPVGIICNAIGGSGTEAWVDVETLEGGMPEVLVNWRKNDYVQPWAQGRADLNTGNDITRRHPYEPGYLFATGIRPLESYPVAGVIWYQGESNAHNIEVHEGLFKLLVESWRKQWNEPELPFFFTQLSSINRPSWPEFRNSQRLLAKSIPGTAMAVSHDWGDSLDVHPRNKRPVGERLGRIALNRVYSVGNLNPSGPLPLRAEVIAPGTVMIDMEYGNGLTTSDGKPARTFEVAEIDGIYYPAEATLSDNQIILKNMDITNPRFVRYAWQPFTRANLVNSDSLPASTFKIEITETPESEEGIASGVSAAFAGTVDGKVIKAGGCNFPVNPMAPGSVKKFYQAIYELVPQADGSIVSKKIGMLPEPIAYGASATTPKGLVAIGGTTASSALSSVLLISLDANGNAVVSELPSLPATVDNCSAAYLDGKVYVAGGNVNGVPSNSLFCLDLEAIGKGWKELKKFPGNPRVQPVLAASKDVKGKGQLYMWGGFAGKGDNREATLNTDGLAFNPASGKWSELASPVNSNAEPVSTGGGIAVTLPDGRIVVTGGVNKDVFLEALRNQAPDYLSHPIEWYRFNDQVCVYDPVASTWSLGGTDSEIARAGAAAAVTPEGEIWLIGGELKPRIRTPKVSKIKL
ncbi:MAG: cyclically-permuted mutarotase family protein [Muribaculaceae bacterium]|nr:cyclically-permuted mutarotase family protein [Muribaculaceae bacterium]